MQLHPTVRRISQPNFHGDALPVMHSDIRRDDLYGGSIANLHLHQ